MWGTRSLRHLSVVAAAAAFAVTAASTPATAEGRPRPPVPAGSTRLRGAVDPDVARVAASGARDRVALSVALTRGASDAGVVSVARQAGGSVRLRIPAIHAVSIEVPAVAAARVAEALARRPDVRRVDPVRARSFGATPNDPAARPYLDAVNAPQAWDRTTGSPSVKIAVVDSGVDTGHPDLAGKVVGTYNAVDGTAAVPDTEGHGTAVAGVAAAATNNGIGIAGAGYHSSVLAVKIDDAEGAILSDAVAAGIVWAADNGAHVLNLSFGGAFTDTAEADAVAYAIGKGAIVVAAAGNDGTDEVQYPAGYTDVVSVGATDGTSRASFSNYGPTVDVGAPGVGIVAPLAGGNTYATVAGTSFSAPIVAGEFALLRAAYGTAGSGVLREAVTSATTGTFGFAHGRVDFAGAFAYLPPTTFPTITQPTNGGTVSGTVTVTATSSAPRVRFTAWYGGLETVDVVDGTASATFPTWGHTGSRTFGATDCNEWGCHTQGASTVVTIQNTPPTITAPTAGTEVNTAQFTASATAPGGGVRFYVDGVSVGHDGTAPYSIAIGTSALAEGTHTLTAVACDSSGFYCDAAAVSAPVSFLVAALHPTVTATPYDFSPNGDGRIDATTVTYSLDVPQEVILQVRVPDGAVVRGGGSMGTKAAGTYTWSWNGRRTDGTMAPNGTYHVEVLTRKVTPNGELSGYARAGVRLDTSAPGLNSISGHGTTFYPVKDAYKDTFSPAVTLTQAGRLHLNVYNSANQRVRSIDAGVRTAVRHTVPWNGRKADGTLVPAGTYRYEFVARDTAQNTRVSGRYTVYVSHKKLVAKTATKVVQPATSVGDELIGYCSAAFTPARSDWPGSIAYYSEYECADPYDSTADLSATEHAFTLPSALKYGVVRVAATGERAVTGYADQGFLLYVDKTDEVPGTGVGLGSTYATYWGPSVPASSYLSGRTVRWIAGTLDGNWYRVRSFTVRWTYYVLV